MTATPDSARIVVFDTTLRDGEQSPGCSMNLEEKLRVAAMLEEMGVDVIEAGFPIASDGDFEAVHAIAKVTKNSIVAGLARAMRRDIERCAEAIKPAQRKRIHTFVSTSPIHMKYNINKTEAEVLQMIVDSVTLARNFTDDVEWSAMDATRSEHDFLSKCVETAIKHGATTINIPDTVGYAIPEEFGALIRHLRGNVPNIDKAVISVHCHNDLGLAVANALAGIAAGARQAEVTINGIGERAGNAALEEFVMALKVRGDAMPYTTGVDSTQITKASRLLSTITGFTVQPNKAIVGANAFAHESGIHQDGMLKHKGSYEIMSPETVGLTKSNLVLGKHSGSHAFKAKLKDLGYELGDNALRDAFARFKTLADRKKDVFDEDLIALVDDETGRDHEHIKFESLAVVAGSKGPQSAELEVLVDGVMHTVSSSGNGPVDACFNAIKQIFPHEAKLVLYQVSAVTEGTDAQAEVTVRLEENGRTVNGQGADTDTLVASVRAYLHALNKLMVKRTRAEPEEADAGAKAAWGR